MNENENEPDLEKGQILLEHKNGLFTPKFDWNSFDKLLQVRLFKHEILINEVLLRLPLVTSAS